MSDKNIWESLSPVFEDHESSIDILHKLKNDLEAISNKKLSMRIDIKDAHSENDGIVLLYIVWIVAPQLRNNGFKLITVVEGDFSQPRFPVKILSHLENDENGRTIIYEDIGQEEFEECFQKIISSSNVQYKIKETYTLVKDHNFYREFS